ncbi:MULTISPECIES: hypothetical protein [Moorena]|uniref:hypothetical protein n=1 Tax=Moorena TaxID=1155738 RepID=UPI0002D4C821|nr:MULTISPECIES: hypothetical protein [Moorena]NEP34172.1 hypothetical protein [Moorena sp. SIO3B2]NEP64452.1 hypothetical protein [Moorena sp. SIO3A5]NEQ07839.1 hypothetical protein [Moorena sp. SIO4E2]NER87616.1 hypothetical protein [Moorena sp. SIO3A2]NET67674.1 hypothetical protein [Moorena sp. SIO1G6]
MVSGQLCGTGFQPVKHRSAVSGQRSAVSGQRSALWHRLPACDFTQIKQMLTCVIHKLIADG